MDEKQLKLMMAAALAGSDSTPKPSDVQKADAKRDAMQKVEKIFKAHEDGTAAKLTRTDSSAEDWLQDDDAEDSTDESSTC
jgi:hypothetical protein